ncbi:MAG: UDP-N-acetylmuramoyl-L-alanyl-D-glutamate--2,6-diaminopimelate ligase [Bacillota bacterium]
MSILKKLLAGIEHQVLQGNPCQEITGIEYDSRQVKNGNAFICIPGFKTDGHNYAVQAVMNGARTLIVERPVEGCAECTMVQVKDTRQVLPLLASRFYRAPSKELRVVGVTGTNGKTTTTHLIKAILEEAGHAVGLIGTLNASFQGYQEKLANTTPESLDLERFMRRVCDHGGRYVVMEVSSHALDLGRVREIDFDAAVFTNLTQDHLDYHKTLEVYRDAKLKLFSSLPVEPGRFAVINADDPHSASFLNACRGDKITYGTKNSAAVRATDIRITAKGSYFTVEYPNGRMPLGIRLAGLFNVYNALAAITFAIQEGIPPQVIKEALEKVQGVPGRFETIDEGQEFSVIVDYAHTPDGLENILKTARQITGGRIITVFGAGGDRDRTKRPLMGRIAADFSDFCIVTSDNPRNEDPLAIIEDILAGLTEKEDAHYAVVPDRREAIRHAVYLAHPDDMVVIAGKGHEDYQLIKGKVYPFDDRLVAREYIRERERYE